VTTHRLARLVADMAALAVTGEDHLDWHPSMAHYAAAKARGFAAKVRNQGCGATGAW
jgi:UDP-N-acetylmuramoylalanine-D-glutamate ligase